MTYDKEFLKKLDFTRQKTSLVRITALNNNEVPIEYIEGRVTSGSISIQGKSVVRRICNLTVTANNIDTIITDELWSLNTKFKVEIGVCNNIDPSYPDIIWFPQGLFIIQSFSKNESTSSLSVNISGQDKMCRLNGTISGSLPAQHDFGQIEEEAPDGTITLTKIPIRTIIKEAVQEYAQELPGNIVIKDLPDSGYELYSYIGNDPLYIIVKVAIQDGQKDVTAPRTPQVINVTFDGTAKFTTKVYDGTEWKDSTTIALSDLSTYFYLNNLSDVNINYAATVINYGGTAACVVKIENGDNIGYHQIDLVYNSDLICNAGETVTSMLDKLVKMLGNYEYFYDVNGKFIFQQKKNYTQALFSPLSGDTPTANMYASSYSYKFENKELLTQISYNPTVANVKNDFIIWGNKQDANGNDWPIHARYAVDKKPSIYSQIPINLEEKLNIIETQYNSRLNDIKNNIYITEEIRVSRTDTLNTWKTKQESYWRNEAIETTFMSKSKFEEFLKGEKDKEYKYYYFQPVRCNCTTDDEGNLQFEVVDEILPSLLTTQVFKCKEDDEITTTKQILTPDDIYHRYILIDWREIIYRMAVDYQRFRETDSFYADIERLNPQYEQGITNYEQYYTDLFSFWRDIYSPNLPIDEQYITDTINPYYCFTKKIIEDPTQLTFWIDFLDTEGQLKQYSVKNIDSRIKVVNDSDVKVIYQEEVPEALFIFEDEPNTVAENDGRTPINLPSLLKNFVIRSTRGKSAVETANETAVDYTCLSQTFSVSAIPIYYLEPNTKIYLPEIGDCVLTDIRYTLGQSGMMSLSGSKIIKDWH